MPNINKTALSIKNTFTEHGATIRKNKKKSPKTRANKNIAILISLACLFGNYIRQQPFALQDRNYQYPVRNAILRRHMESLVRNLHREVRMFLSKS